MEIRAIMMVDTVYRTAWVVHDSRQGKRGEASGKKMVESVGNDGDK